jgi:hypothetical protein
MRYMFLIYNSEAARGGASVAELDSCNRAHLAVIEEAAKRGVLAGASPLEPTGSAKTVRLQEGKPLVTDGPFAETKEQLGGYYILECENFEQAIAWAAKIPTVRGLGCVEIRPLAPSHIPRGR